jgi:3-oxoacyl-[acyl-carrier-protein] synthase-3
MKVIGTGSALPRKEVTNEDLTRFLDTSDEWISSRTGIRSRRVITDEKLEDLAVEAAEKALAQAGIPASDLDYILCSNIANHYVTPGLSCVVAGRIGAACPAVDINCACPGFLYAMDIAEAFFKTGRVRNVLIICAEEATRMLDWTDRSTCILFGDGAGAAVFAPGDNIKGVRMACEPAVDILYECRRLNDTPFLTKREEDIPLQMNGREVFKFAVSTAVRDIESLLEEAGLTTADIQYFMIHQANLRIIEAIRKRLDVPEEKFPTHVEDHGNTSSASCAILLDECNRKGMFRRGDKLVFSAFGAGLLSGAILMEW